MTIDDYCEWLRCYFVVEAVTYVQTIKRKSEVQWKDQYSFLVDRLPYMFRLFQLLLNPDDPIDASLD